MKLSGVFKSVDVVAPFLLRAGDALEISLSHTGGQPWAIVLEHRHTAGGRYDAQVVSFATDQTATAYVNESRVDAQLRLRVATLAEGDSIGWTVDRGRHGQHRSEGGRTLRQRGRRPVANVAAA